MLLSVVAATLLPLASVQMEAFETALKGAPAGDRDCPGVTVDVGYRLNIPGSWWTAGPATPATHAGVMSAFHGEDVWSSAQTREHFEQPSVKKQLGKEKIYGSPLSQGIIHTLLQQTNPKLILEVGVFRGSTSIAMAKLLDTMPALKDTFIISMDSWLLDLRFVWGAPSSRNHNPGYSNTSAKATSRFKMAQYFRNVEIGGGSQMYWRFLHNVMLTNTQHRIVPMQTASSNGALALISHRLRPGLIYVDASHANPDVFIDYENFYQILEPGGALAVDDIRLVPACKIAFAALCKRYSLTPVYGGPGGNQAYVFKPANEGG
jgi:hypothetical protein